MEEDGQEIQIKITLTAAKDNVAPGDDVALPGTVNNTATNTNITTNIPKKEPVQATEEEKQKVQDLLRAIGL